MSNRSLGNSPISSKNKTHLCASDISQGCAFAPHQTILALELVLWILRNGLVVIRGCSAVNIHANEYRYVTSMISSKFIGGNNSFVAFASMLFHHHGGPTSSTLCIHATAIANARFATRCHWISSKDTIPDDFFSQTSHRLEFVFQSNFC